MALSAIESPSIDIILVQTVNQAFSLLAYGTDSIAMVSTFRILNVQNIDVITGVCFGYQSKLIVTDERLVHSENGMRYYGLNYGIEANETIVASHCLTQRVMLL